ncbi:MAG: DUF2267 domain-containing protein [Pseudomonadota bacterium]
MSAQGLEVIDHTVHTTHEWINELASRLDWTSKRCALRLLRSTLQQLRDHMLPDEMAQFSAQLPLLIRGFFFEGWVPKQTPVKQRGAAEFTEAIEMQLGQTDEYRGPQDIRYVFDLLNARLSAGEIEDVRAGLPSAIRDLWPAP